MTINTCHADIRANSTIELFHEQVFQKRAHEIKGRVNQDIIYGICENDYVGDPRYLHLYLS